MDEALYLNTRVSFSLAKRLHSAGYLSTNDGYWYAEEAVERRDGEWYKKGAFLDTIAMDKVKTEYLKFLISAPKLLNAMDYLCALTGCSVSIENIEEEKDGTVSLKYEGIICTKGKQYDTEMKYSTEIDYDTRSIALDQTLQYLAKMFAPKVTILEKLFK